MKHWTAGNWTGAQWFGPTYSAGVVAQLSVTDEPDTLYAQAGEFAGSSGAALQLIEVPFRRPKRFAAARIVDAADSCAATIRANVDASVAATDAQDSVASVVSARTAASIGANDAQDAVRSGAVVGIRAKANGGDREDFVRAASKLGPLPIADDEILLFLMAS